MSSRPRQTMPTISIRTSAGPSEGIARTSPPPRQRHTGAPTRIARPRVGRDGRGKRATAAHAIHALRRAGGLDRVGLYAHRRGRRRAGAVARTRLARDAARLDGDGRHLESLRWHRSLDHAGRRRRRGVGDRLRAAAGARVLRVPGSHGALPGRHRGPRRASRSPHPAGHRDAGRTAAPVVVRDVRRRGEPRDATEPDRLVQWQRRLQHVHHYHRHPTSTTTTSTTLPGCDTAATFPSIACRLVVLGTRVELVVVPSAFRASLLAMLQGRVMKNVQQAEQFATSGDRHRARARLGQAAHGLKNFVRRLNSSRGRKAVAQSSGQTLDEEARALRKAIDGLAASL